METRQINTIKLKIDSVMEKRSIIKKAPVDLFIRVIINVYNSNNNLIFII